MWQGGRSCPTAPPGETTFQEILYAQCSNAPHAALTRDTGSKEGKKDLKKKTVLWIKIFVSPLVNSKNTQKCKISH